MQFRNLSKDEDVEFREWARENYTPGGEISSLWHPAVVDECEAMNREAENA